ncbi:MAG: glycosyltransferase family 2 protein [Solirubrobacteraceae bacterium]
MTPPQVSVVMPVRDGAEHLEDAARSILSQTLTDLELVIVDDGSRDGTRDVMARLRDRDRRVTVVATSGRSGIAHALNEGCAAARGRYLARLDADDISLPTRLEQQVLLLNASHEIGIVGGQMIATDLVGKDLWQATYPIDDHAIRSMAESANPFGGSTVTMRRDVFEACGGHRESLRYAEDYDLWMRMLERCRGANLAEPVVLYRVHPGQTTFRDWREHCLCTLAIEEAARCRRAEGRDPLEGIELITEAVVHRLGVSDETVRTRLIESLLSLAVLASMLGSKAERDRLLAAAAVEARGGTAPPELIATLHLSIALAAFDQGEHVRGVAALAKSLRADAGPATSHASVWLWSRHRWVFRAKERLQRLIGGRA